MDRLSALIPDRRNPMRPVVVIVAIFFGLMLVGLPIGMRLLGLGMGSTSAITVLIVVVAAGIIAWTLALARGYDRDRADLVAGEAWAAWELTPEEHRRFVARESGRTWRQAAAYAAGGTALGVGFGVLADDWLTGGIMIGAFLLAAVIIVTAGGPPRARSTEARQVLVGPRGITALGRYMPLEGTGIRATSVRLEDGEPSALVFDVRSGRRIDEVRVPVPRARAAEAEALVERFRTEAGLAG